MSDRGVAATFALIFCILFMFTVWTLEDRESELALARGEIAVLALENAGLEARVTREALHAYCRVECGSCISMSAAMTALSMPPSSRAMEIMAISDEEYELEVSGG